MVKKIATALGISALIYVGCFTSYVEDLFNIDPVTQCGGLLEYCFLGLIAWALLNGKEKK